MTQQHFSINVRVYVEDTDYGGIVYHANYLKYMERARTDYLLNHGYSLRDCEDEGFLIVIAHADIQYCRPAKLNDDLIVTAHVSKMGNSSLVFDHEVLAKSDPDTVFAKGQLRLVCISKTTHRPTRIPSFLREKFMG